MSSIADREQPKQRSSDAPRLVRMKSILRVSTSEESLRALDIKRDMINFSSDESSSVIKQLSFKDVTIREYGLTVGDHPSCSSGPPLSLDWKYTETHSTPLEVYERIRPPRRGFYDLVLDRDDRQERLIQDWHVSRVEIAQAVHETFKTKNQRRRSIHNSSKKTTQKLDLFIESARRKLKRTLLFQKRTSVRVEDMMQQASRAAAHMAANEVDDEVDNPLDESKLSKTVTEPWDDAVSSREYGIRGMEEPVYENGPRHQYLVASTA